MVKRKNAADAFGLSLLDVLSNALGGVILLMLIIAATINGNDKRRLNKPQESKQGKKYSAIEFEKGEKKNEFNLLLAQVRLINGSGEISIGGEHNNKCSLAKYITDISPDMETNWLAIRMGEMNGTWDLILHPGTGTTYPDSVSVFITIDDIPYCSKIVKLKRDLKDNILLSVREQGKDQPQINIAGTTACP